jgi:hypothetical protein
MKKKAGKLGAIEKQRRHDRGGSKEEERRK